MVKFFLGGGEDNPPLGYLTILPGEMQGENEKTRNAPALVNRRYRSFGERWSAAEKLGLGGEELPWEEE